MVRKIRGHHLRIRLIRRQKCTYLQYDSPLGFDMQDPPCRHGDGEHDINPENSK